MRKLWRLWVCRKTILHRLESLIEMIECPELEGWPKGCRVNNAKKVLDYIEGRCDINGKYF